MEYAKDKITGKYIQAINALPLRNRYICPVCGADCHLRKGIKRRAYFAHNSGAASEDCENYFPSSEFRREEQNAFFTIQPSLPTLYCAIEDSSKELPHWKISILIPEWTHGAGRVEVTQAYYGIVTIPANKLSQAGQRVRVRPLAQYQINVIAEHNSSYLEKFPRTMQGLSTQWGNVFPYLPTGGRKLNDNQSLYWGQDYCIIWNKTLDLVWWPRNEVFSRLELDSEGDWFSAIIKLPVKEDYQVMKWVEMFLNKEIKKKPVTLSLIAPTVIRQLEDETLVLPNGEEVILAVTDADLHDELELNIALPDGTNKTLSLNCDLPCFISIGKLPLGRTDVWLQSNPNISLNLYSIKLEEIYSPKGVEFIFAESNTQQKMSIPIYSTQIKTKLEEIKNGCLKLVDVSFPRRVSVIIRFRERTSKHWESLLLKAEYVEQDEVKELKHKEFKNKVIKEIITKVNMSIGELEVDFGNYGKVNMDYLYIKNSKRYTLDYYWRYKLKWVISILKSNNQLDSTGEAIRLLKREFVQISLDNIVSEDRLLLECILKHELLPKTVEVIIREFTKNIHVALKKI